MKKKLVFALFTVMAFAMAGCGNNKEETPAEPETVIEAEETISENEPDTESVSDEITDTDTVTDDTENAEEIAESVGQSMLARFEGIVTGEPELTAEEVAAKMLEGDVVPFAPMTMAVEEGLLSGFDNVEITGFSEGAMFSPMIGTIPFIGYIFTLPEDADVESFVATLEENANLRWNICTEAEEMVTGNVDSKVFFLMCPAAFEEAPADTEAFSDEEYLDAEEITGEEEIILEDETPDADSAQ